jgi:GT2 family glycosyltransferase
MKIVFICVNYNNSNITKNYILNVLKISSNFDVKIVVVDNSSFEDDLECLRNSIVDLDINKDRLILIESKYNLGYFKGLNLGIEWALKNEHPQFIVIGNNDLEFYDDFLLNLMSLDINANELVIAPDIITREGIHENPHLIQRMSFIRKLKLEIYFSCYFVARIITLFYSTERKHKSIDLERKYIHMGIGALYVLTPFFFHHFNKLWDYVFLYGEEAILAGQVNSVNGKIVYEPSLKCYHNESSTTSKLPTKNKYKITQKSFGIYKKYL